MTNTKNDGYKYLEEINLGILKNVPVNSSGKELWVLDVGCGTGALAREISRKGYSVIGIEFNEEACRIAQGRIKKAICCNLKDMDRVKRELEGYEFAYIIFSDILEHLYDPCSVITDYMEFLSDRGNILVSLPNVVVWENRLKFLFGEFNYKDTGIMDRTHVRFFTFKTAKQLVVQAGLKIISTDFTPYFIRAFLPLVKYFYIGKKGKASPQFRRKIIDSRAYRFYLKYVYPLEYFLGYLFRPLFAYRIIIVGGKA